MNADIRARCWTAINNINNLTGTSPDTLHMKFDIILCKQNSKRAESITVNEFDNFIGKDCLSRSYIGHLRIYPIWYFGLRPKSAGNDECRNECIRKFVESTEENNCRFNSFDEAFSCFIEDKLDEVKFYLEDHH